jgi:hypothetical protein
MRWKEIVEELATAAAAADQRPLSVRIMPQHLSTRWIPTYHLLEFSYLYREAIDRITGDHMMELTDYGLSENEWDIVKELRDYEVSTLINYCYTDLTPGL